MPQTTPEPEVVSSTTPRSNVRSLLALHVAVAITVALYFAREVLIPIALAVLLSFVLSPLVDRLRGWRLWRVPSVLISVVVAIGIMLAIGGVIGTQIAQLARDIPKYSGTIEQKITTAQTYITDRVAAVTARLGLRGSREGGAKTGPAAQPGAPGTQGQQKPEQSSSTSAVSIAERYLFPILSPIATAGIVLVVAIFLLLQKEDLRDRVIRLFGSADLHRTTVAMDDAAARVSRYLLTQLSINTAFGVIVGTGVYFIGVPNPLLWGVLSGILRFVPYVGSFASAALPILLAAAVDPGWSMAIWTAVLYIAVELTISQAVEPVLYGHSTGLSPFAVIVSAIFWSWLWGAIGLILSMPLTLCLVVLGRHFEQLRFLDVLLGDRPPLTPVESFYQRILARDPEEAQDHADVLLQEASLSSYYDEVALKGMQLAARDVARGVLSHQQLEQIKETIKALVEELADYEDRTSDREQEGKEIAGAKPESAAVQDEAPPADSVSDDGISPAWRNESAVLCLAGRGPLDEAASAMLAQLLHKHGVGARVLPYRAASREGIANLTSAGVEMICISYLDISGRPAHLRFLLRRLRSKLPNVKILVGLWPLDDPAVKDATVRAAIGADFYTSSLVEAVTACLDEARRDTPVPPASAERRMPSSIPRPITPAA
jgi:predicted PurR-regulated permease PerM